MKQIFQSLKNGETFFIDTPSPKIKANEVLIKTEYSLISSGTERMLVDFGKGNILEKAKPVSYTHLTLPTIRSV